jgi:hypothetical protein
LIGPVFLNQLQGEFSVVPNPRKSRLAAIQAYAKINAQGQWVDRSEHVNLNELFERTSKDELEAYVRDGKLPGWSRETVGATAIDSQESAKD